MTSDLKVPDRLLGVHEVATILSVHSRTVWGLAAKGCIPPPIKVGGGRSARWRLSEIEAWIAAGCPADCQQEGEPKRNGHA